MFASIVFMEPCVFIRKYGVYMTHIVSFYVPYIGTKLAPNASVSAILGRELVSQIILSGVRVHNCRYLK